MKRLIDIQQKLKAPKEQTNSFGGYKYRNCEDILEAVKPLLAEHKLLILLNDEIFFMEGRFYVKATATLFDEEGKEITHTIAYAREEENKPKMDGSQVTGSSSSYARKYALNGLFAIDDTKDSDATNKHGKEEKKEQEKENAGTEISLENALEELKMFTDPSNAFDYFQKTVSRVADKKTFRQEYQKYYNELKKKG